MSGYSKMDSTDQKPDSVNSKIQKPDPVSVEIKARLSRNKSVSASATKTNMSMRRSSSVSERYCRIYDQRSATWPLPFNEEDENEEGDKEKVQNKKIKKKKAFLKACKRFFGIS